MTTLSPQVLLLQPPSPPHMNVARDYAGGYGIASPSHRPTYGRDPENAPIPHVSLLYCAGALLSRGLSVAFLEAQAEGLGLEEVVERVKGAQPEWLVAALNLPSLPADLALLEEVKKAVPALKIAAIGTVCKALAGLVLASEAVDLVVRGDPEAVLPAALVAQPSDWEGLPGLGFRNGGQVVLTRGLLPAFDLGSAPDPPFHLLPLDLYRHPYFGPETRFMTVLSSKGCPFGCSYYCPYPFGFGKRVTFAPPSRVAEQVETLYKEHQVGAILFRDQNLTLNRGHAHAICDQFLARRLSLRWVCETRLDCVDQGLLEKMRRAGCVRIHYGLESGHPQLFSQMGKPGARLSELKDVVAMTRRAGIHAHLFVLVGLPGETWATVRQTVRLLREWGPDSVQVGVVTPYPGTTLFAEARAKGLLLSTDWRMYTGFRPVMRTEAMSASELARAQRYILWAWQGRPWLSSLAWGLRAMRRVLDGSVWRRLGEAWKGAS